MRRFLPVVILFLVLSSWFLVLSSPVRADWLQDLFFGTENVTKDLENANKGLLPLIDLIPAREPTPTGSGQPARQSAQPQTTPSSTNNLLDLAGGYAVGCSLTSPCTTPVPNDLGSFFANLIGDLLGIRTTGNDLATKYVEEGVPQGAALQVFQRLQKSGQDIALSNNSNSNVLGISLLGHDPMKVAFGASQCQKLPPIPGSNCTETGTFTSLPQVTPTPYSSPSPDLTISPGPQVTISPIGLVYYSQRDPRYAYYPPGQQCNILKVGCGPTTVAMILSSLISPINSPDYVVKTYYGNRVGDIIRGVCQGTSIYTAKDTLFAQGLNVSSKLIYLWTGGGEPVDRVLPVLKNYIDSGWTVFMGANVFSVGHFFWITTITRSGDYFVMDPWYGWNSSLREPKQPQPISAIANNLKSNTVFKYAFVVRKI